MATSSPTEKSIADLIKQLERARAETQSYSETWDDVGRKIKNSINPLKDIEKQLEIENVLLTEKESQLIALKKLQEEGFMVAHDISEIEGQIAQHRNQISGLKTQATLMALAYDTLIKLVDAYDKYDKLLADNAVKQ